MTDKYKKVKDKNIIFNKILTWQIYTDYLTVNKKIKLVYTKCR
jgi:hypothetical protein